MWILLCTAICLRFFFEYAWMIWTGFEFLINTSLWSTHYTYWFGLYSFLFLKGNSPISSEWWAKRTESNELHIIWSPFEIMTLSPGCIFNHSSNILLSEGWMCARALDREMNSLKIQYIIFFKCVWHRILPWFELTFRPNAQNIFFFWAGYGSNLICISIKW